MKKSTYHIFVTALLKSIWPEEQLASCLGVDIESQWQTYKELIQRAQHAVCPAASIELSQKESPSPFAYIWDDKRADGGQRRRPNLTTPVAELPADVRSPNAFLFPGTGESDSGDLLNKLKQKLKSYHHDTDLPEAQNLFLLAEALQSLIRNYTSTIAVSGHYSLYDYARLSAAVAICIQNVSQGEEEILFVKGDFSGIQEFIFDTDSKGAAKALKARSLRIQALSFMATDYLLKNLDLSPANLLYNGGGTFYLLAGSSQEATLQACRFEIAQKAMTPPHAEVVFPESVHLVLGHARLNLGDFHGGFGQKWQALDANLNQNRIYPLDLSRQAAEQPDVQGKTLFDHVFNPLEPYNFTFRRKLEKGFYRNITKGPQSRLQLSEDYGSTLNRNKGFTISSLTEDWQREERVKFYVDELEEDEEEKSIPNPYTAYGREFLLKEDAAACQVLINDSQLMLDSWGSGETFSVPKPVTYLVKDLPVWNANMIADNEKVIVEFAKKKKGLEQREYDQPREDFIISFGYLAEFAASRTGTAKLGILKMDVDNLGTTFSNNLRDAHGNSSLIHTASLSRAMEWFFEGYINILLDTHLEDWFQEAYGDEVATERLQKFREKLSSNTQTFRDNIYVIFSGGDDCFMVGAWDLVVEFANLVRKKFEAFTAKTLSLSAGIVMVGPKFPVSRFAVLAEEALSMAKSVPNKNAICLFGEVLSWKDFDASLKLRNTLYYLVTREDRKERESRALLWKVQKSMAGYRRIFRQIETQGTIYLSRIWKLSYYLRDVKKVNKQLVETEIIDLYSDLLKNKLNTNRSRNGNQTASPLLIAIGVRLTEFMSRNNNKTNS